ncbi:MAG: ABC transporter transmembrane domain-containing protein, partial [Pseudomonadota bacterium]
MPDNPDATPSSRKSVRPLRRLLPFVRPYVSSILLALLFMGIAAAATLYLPVAVRGMIDEGFNADNAGQIDRHFFVLFGVAMVMGIAAAARFYWVSWIGERVTADIRAAVYGHIVWMSPAFFERTRTGEVLSRLNTDTTLIQTVVGSSASIALRSGLMLIGAATLLVLTSPRLAGMMAFVIPVVLVPILVFGRKVRTLSRDSQDRVADFSALANESIAAITTVQSFTAEDHETRRFAGQVERAFDTARRRILFRSFMTVCIVLLVFGAISFVMYKGATAVAAGDMTAGTLGQFVLYAVLTASSTAALSEVWGEVQRAAGATERIVQLLDITPDIRSPEKPTTLPSPSQGALAFRDVTFHYPSRPDAPVFEGLSFEVAPGETVALVGPSGAGKTTVLQLLLRFYDVQGGSVSVDGVDVRDAELTDLRMRFGLVAQDSVIFSTSAMENIRYGRPDASDADVLAAAHAANAHDFIADLPDGYDSHLGERGVRLSGGQRQRIAIARALLRDPPVLLLDEATSALDAISEDVVQRALERLMASRTTLVIAHRLATVQDADRILVLNEGGVVAQGRHAELMAGGGL